MPRKNIESSFELFPKKECTELNPWIEAGNHLWWFGASCNGDVSCTTFETNIDVKTMKYMKKFQHSKLTKHEQKRKMWLKEGSHAFMALEEW